MAEVEPVFTEDNTEEVKEVQFSSNLKTSPGMDRLTSLPYKECWDSVGSLLHKIVTAVWEGEALTVSQRTSHMVFGSNATKQHRKKPKDKRCISLLNYNLKLTLTHLQVVSGKNKDRDALNATSSTKAGCALLVPDFIATFYYQTLEWPKARTR